MFSKPLENHLGKRTMELNDAIDLYFQYLRVEKGVSNETIKNYSYDLREFFKALPKETTDDMLAVDISDFVKVQLKRGLSIPTILRRISSTKNFYLFLEREHIIDFNLKDFEKPRGIKRLPRILSIEEVEDLLNAPDLEKKDGFRDRAMLELMYSSGLRVSELLSLKVRQVNLNKGIINVIGKGNKERKVPIGEYASDFLKKYIEEVRSHNPGKRTEYLFLNKYGNPISRQYFFKQIKKYAEMAGIEEDVSPHTLRHCFATHMIENGAELRALQEMLGHVNLSTTQIYTNVSTKRILDAYDLFTKRK